MTLSHSSGTEERERSWTGRAHEITAAPPRNQGGREGGVSEETKQKCLFYIFQKSTNQPTNKQKANLLSQKKAL